MLFLSVFQEPQEIQSNTTIHLYSVNMFWPKSSSLVNWDLNFLQINILYVTGMNQHKYEKLLLPLHAGF